MPIAKELTEVVACPKCKGKVTLAPAEAGFDCAACKLRFPIADGLPNFLIDDALPLPAAG